MKKLMTVTMMALVLSASLAVSAVTVFSPAANAQTKTVTALMLQKAHAEEAAPAQAEPTVDQALTATEQAPITEPTQDEWFQWLSKMGSMQGAKALVIAIFVLQGLLLLGRSQFVKLEASTKFWVVSILAFLVALGNELLKADTITLMTIVQALLSGGVLAAINVFLHQGVKQNFAK